MNINDQIQAIVFDVDGTLFDTFPSLAEAAAEVLSEAGLRPVAHGPMRAALSEGLLPMFRQALALQDLPVEGEARQRLSERFLAHYASRHLAQARPFDGVDALLSMLAAAGLPLAICTNRDPASTRTLLQSAGLLARFDVIVGMGDAPQPKPAADPLLRALAMLGVDPGHAFFVGDSAMDSRCAHAARVPFAGFLGGYASQPQDLLPAALQFARFDQLAGWILERAANRREGAHA